MKNVTYVPVTRVITIRLKGKKKPQVGRVSSAYLTYKIKKIIKEILLFSLLQTVKVVLRIPSFVQMMDWESYIVEFGEEGRIMDYGSDTFRVG